jgi:hypothetical protein
MLVNDATSKNWKKFIELELVGFFFFFFHVKNLEKNSKNLANLVKFYTRKSWKQNTPKISQFLFFVENKNHSANY